MIETEVGFSLKSGFKKIVCTPYFVLELNRIHEKIPYTKVSSILHASLDQQE